MSKYTNTCENELLFLLFLLLSCSFLLLLLTNLYRRGDPSRDASIQEETGNIKSLAGKRKARWKY